MRPCRSLPLTKSNEKAPASLIAIKNNHFQMKNIKLYINLSAVIYAIVVVGLPWRRD
jgi:hypothetical protein